MAQRSFKLSDDLDASLVEVAELEGRTVSNLIVRMLEQALLVRERLAPVVAENLRETASGEIVAADPSMPVRYEQRKSPGRSKMYNGDTLPEGTPLPKIAPRRQPR